MNPPDAAGVLEHAHTRRLFAGLLRAAEAIRSARGASRYGLALGAGAVSAGALAPVFAVPLLFITLPALIWLIDGAGPGRAGIWRAAFIGEAFGFGFFLAGLYWVGNAFLVDADRFAWMIPFVAVLLPAGLALFVALPAAMARWLWCDGWPRILIFAALWVASEWLRGHVLTGFPWNLLGYVWGSLLPMLQSTAWWSVYGLSLVTAIAAGSVALWGDVPERIGRYDTRLGPPAAVVVLFVLVLLGAARLILLPTTYVDNVKLRLVHAAIDQKVIEDRAMREPIFAQYLGLTAESGLESVTHVIWPEAAVPFVLSRDPAALDAIGQTLGPNTVLLTGAPRVQRGAGGGPMHVFNSFHAVDGEGRILVTYDKFHLVPFGEYLPFEKVLEALGLMKLTGGLGSFARGPGPRTLTAPGGPAFGPLICYEIIFPSAVIDPRQRPGFLVNVTDDSWFGEASGPRQHFQTARVRAIEEGLPLARAANKGVSAVIDPAGRILLASEPPTIGVLDSALPKAAAPTLYARLGDAVPGLMILGAMAGGLAGRRLRRR